MAMIRKASGTVLAMLIVGTGLTTVSHAKDPWKDYYKAQEKQEKAYWKFRRKQAHEWEKYERKQAKHWPHYEPGYGPYGW